MGIVAAVEKEEMAVNWAKTTLQEMMVGVGFDSDGDHLILKEEFKDLLMNPEAALMV